MAVVNEEKKGQTGLAPAVDHFTVEERAARGRSARAECPRSSHAGFELASDRDPVAILEAQAASRVPELVPVRYGRMLVSPFTFYRGAAAVMAHDLAPTPGPDCARSSAATPTSPTSAATPRPSARSSSTSTTSTRRCPDRSSGT